MILDAIEAYKARSMARSRQGEGISGRSDGVSAGAPPPTARSRTQVRPLGEDGFLCLLAMVSKSPMQLLKAPSIPGGGAPRGSRELARAAGVNDGPFAASCKRSPRRGRSGFALARWRKPSWLAGIPISSTAAHPRFPAMQPVAHPLA